MNGYATGRQNGWMSANDIRELENLDRIPEEEGGDLYLVNGNMLPLKDAGAFATNTNEQEEENQDEEVLEVGESDTEKSDDTRNAGEPRAKPNLRPNPLPQRTNRRG